MEYVYKTKPEEASEVEEYIRYELYCENKVISFLEKLLTEMQENKKDENYKYVEKGLFLHKKRLKVLQLFQKASSRIVHRNEMRLKRLLCIGNKIKFQLALHEGLSYDGDWKAGYESDKQLIGI